MHGRRQPPRKILAERIFFVTYVIIATLGDVGGVPFATLAFVSDVIESSRSCALQRLTRDSPAHRRVVRTSTDRC